MSTARRLRSNVVQTPRLFHFVGGESGPWQVTHHEAACGENIARVPRLEIHAGEAVAISGHALWSFRGITSNERYVEGAEKKQLLEKQEGLGRPESLAAAMILIRKSEAWWALQQDERRKIFESDSEHIQIGLSYLPAVARRLHHCRDLGENEPFDFITWFEFNPTAEEKFNSLAQQLRSSVEWKYVEREIDMRFMRSV